MENKDKKENLQNTTIQVPRWGDEKEDNDDSPTGTELEIDPERDEWTNPSR